MKILLFLTGFRQLEEYKYFNIFYEKNKLLKEISDVFIYCNNPEISEDIVTYYKNNSCKNKQLFITTKNMGHTKGGVEAVCSGIEMGLFKEYDYVLHFHPDIFIIDEVKLINILNEHINNDNVFLVNYSFHDHMDWFSFDFFIFKPKKLIQNIFIEELSTFTEYPENYLYKMIHKYNVKYEIIKRYNNNNWIPRRIDDHIGLWHEHDLEKIQEYIKTCSP